MHQKKKIKSYERSNIMNHQKTISIEPCIANYIKKLLNMTGREIYDKYGLTRDETITETAIFEETDYEMDIKLIIPIDENDTPWTEAVLFYDGYEVCCSDVEYEFFGLWELDTDTDNFIVHIV